MKVRRKIAFHTQMHQVVFTHKAVQLHRVKEKVSQHALHPTPDLLTVWSAAVLPTPRVHQGHKG